MKKYLFLVLSAILFSINSNANEVSVFQKIFVNLPAKVTILKSDKYEVDVISNDSVVYKSIDYKVIDGTLKFTKKRDDINSDDVRIIIYTPSVPKVSAGNNYQMTELPSNKERNRKEA